MVVADILGFLGGGGEEEGIEESMGFRKRSRVLVRLCFFPWEQTNRVEK